MDSGTERTRRLHRADGRARRVLVFLLSLLAILLATAPLAARASAYSLLLSSSADRSAPAPLEGKTASGNIYVFVSPSTGVTQVRFYLDDPNRTGSPIKIENGAPWDFAGTASDTARSAKPYDSNLLANGQHTITAAIDKSAGGTDVISDVVSANFTVSNGGSGSPVPTQWIAKVTTESLGRPPVASEWNDWVTYYSSPSRECTAETLETLGASRYKSSEFLGRGYDNAEKLLALYRGALNREPRESEVMFFLPPLNTGALSWNTLVDGIFNSAEFQTLAPRICAPLNPAYGFDPGSVGDLKDWAGGGPSRTQQELQQALNDAEPTNSTTSPTSCPTVNTVELAPKEVIRIGGDQQTGPDNAPLRIPPCVKLTTSGAPDAQHYAEMARLVPNGLICARRGPTCDHIELVRMSNGAKLSNVWVDGKGLDDPSNFKIGLVGTRSGERTTEVLDNRLSDPPADGTAVRAAGYGTTGTPCAGRVVSRNLVTGYATEHAQSPLGKARWADGLSIFCEQATVEDNDIVDISDSGIVVYGSWNSASNQLRIQRSTVSGNLILSAGNSAHVALGADAVGECLADTHGPPVSCIEFSHDRGIDNPSKRSFTGTSVTDNTFWTGARTHFDIGLMIGSGPMWGDNGPLAQGASFTNNTVGDVTTTRVNTGIAVSGMYDTVLTGNTSSYDVIDTNPAITEDKCPQGNVLYDPNTSTFALGSATPDPTLYHCFAYHPPSGGMEWIERAGTIFVGKNSRQRFNPWGRNDGIYPEGFDHKIDVSELRETKEMGANVVRLHLQFKDIMASCSAADETALAELDDTLRRAEENGIYLILTGLSSYAGDGAGNDPDCYRNATQEQRWAAQEAFWQAVAQRVAGSPAVFALDIMNEPVVPGAQTPCWTGPAPPGQPDPYCGTAYLFGYFFRQNITRTPTGSAAEIGRAWVTRMRDAIRAYDAEHLITLGCLADATCAGLNAADMAGLLDYLSVHIYPRDCTGPALPDPDPCAVGGERTVEHGTGEPLKHELALLQDYAGGGAPVVVEETFPLPLPDDPGLVRTFILASTPYATGWLGAWGHKTLSQEIAGEEHPMAEVWGKTFQRLTSTVSPCGACQP